MKILIPILGFGRTGGYRVLSKFANTWLTCDHEVVFLCPDSSEEPYFPTSAKVLWVDGKGIVSKVRNKKSKPSGPYHLKTLLLGLRKIGYQFDIIIANHSFTAWPVALAPCGEAKKVYYVQAYEPEYYINKKNIKGYILAFLSALSYYLPLKIVVNSPIYFKYKNLRAAQFVPPGLDLTIFKPFERQKKLCNKKKIIIGCIGRSEPEKGTVYVLRAFEKLHQIDQRFFLKVAYGNLPSEWQHEECEIVIPNNDCELAAFYRSIDILVAAGTVQHGAPHYPVMEALASRTNVVTTGYLGATEETAWLVNNMDFHSIVKSILLLIDDDKSCEKKRNSGLKLMCEYSWDVVSEKMLKAINNPH